MRAIAQRAHLQPQLPLHEVKLTVQLPLKEFTGRIVILVSMLRGVVAPL
jgi:hypothetical protein